MLIYGQITLCITFERLGKEKQEKPKFCISDR